MASKGFTLIITAIYFVRFYQIRIYLSNRVTDVIFSTDFRLKQKETEVADLTSQLNNYKTEISKLSNECEAQREKNNVSILYLLLWLLIYCVQQSTVFTRE